MKIISGSARGRNIDAPTGELTRPTSSLVKGAMFNIIQFNIEGSNVLDLFAGSGQLGIEALSRGAYHAVFADCRRDAIAIIDKNLKLTGFLDRAEVFLSDFSELIKRRRPREFDIIFLDPPYGSGLLSSAISQIISFDILRESGIIMCECARNDVLSISSSSYRIRKEYFYGAKKLILIERD